MNKWIAIRDTMNRMAADMLLSCLDAKELHAGHCCVFYERDGRFANDQIFSATDEGALILDGVILNLKELNDAYEANNVDELILKLEKNDPDTFFTSFTGPFSGMKYSKTKDTFIAFCNQTGDAPLFYYQNN